MTNYDLDEIQRKESQKQREHRVQGSTDGFGRDDQDNIKNILRTTKPCQQWDAQTQSYVEVGNDQDNIRRIREDTEVTSPKHYVGFGNFCILTNPSYIILVITNLNITLSLCIPLLTGFSSSQDVFNVVLVISSESISRSLYSVFSLLLRLFPLYLIKIIVGHFIPLFVVPIKLGTYLLH
jgi:hypothetical protein